jgi:hypothetical protein
MSSIGHPIPSARSAYLMVFHLSCATPLVTRFAQQRRPIEDIGAPSGGVYSRTHVSHSEHDWLHRTYFFCPIISLVLRTVNWLRRRCSAWYCRRRLVCSGVSINCARWAMRSLN